MFREFKVGDLFETNPYRGGFQVLTGGNVPSKNLNPGDTPRISVTSKNNGIIGYYEDVDMKSYRVFENAISVSFLGTVFYHPYRASYDMKVHCLRLKDHELRECEALYLVSVLRKLVSVFSYSNQISSTELVGINLKLPVRVFDNEPIQDDNGNFIPDWDYMDSRIRELEAARIRELDAYLQSTGLDTVELTDEEATIHRVLRTFGEFKIGDLFDGITGDTDIKKVHLDGEGYPVITAGVDNLGVAGYSSINAKILPANSLTVDMFGNCYFRPFEYKMVTHARVFALVLKDGEMTTEIGLFLCLMLQWLRHMHHYSNMCSYNKIKESIIKLPLKLGTDIRNFSETDIDWDYMEATIRITEKQVISDVIDYKDAVIAKTKEIVN